MTNYKTYQTAVCVCMVLAVCFATCCVFLPSAQTAKAQGGAVLFVDKDAPWQTLAESATAFPQETPSKEGFVFGGWLAQGTFAPIYQPGDALPSGATTFFAIWHTDSYQNQTQGEPKDPFFKPWQWGLLIGGVVVMLVLIGIVVYVRVLKPRQKGKLDEMYGLTKNKKNPK